MHLKKADSIRKQVKKFLLPGEMRHSSQLCLFGLNIKIFCPTHVEKNLCPDFLCPSTCFNTISKSKMILRRLGGGDEAYCTYVEEADNDANKNSALI